MFLAERIFAHVFLAKGDVSGRIPCGCRFSFFVENLNSEGTEREKHRGDRTQDQPGPRNSHTIDHTIDAGEDRAP